VLARLLKGRPIHKDVLSPSCLAMVKQWLQRCDTEHMNLTLEGYRASFLSRMFQGTLTPANCIITRSEVQDQYFQGNDDIGLKIYPGGEFGHCGKLKGMSRESDKLSERGEQLKVHTCPARKAQKLPTRVIDVGSRTEAARLLISEGRTGEWVALSHCWGNTLSFKTDSNNIDRHCKELRIEDFPATFRDALLITRGLGFRYLWIDSLCIIQDTLGADWIKESPYMAHIYGNATITISADASSDSNTGICGGSHLARQPHASIPRLKVYGDTGTNFEYIYLRHQTNLENKRSILSKRAWTLQEEVLSSRVLRYSEDSIQWRCLNGKWDEYYPDRDGGAIHHTWSLTPIRARGMLDPRKIMFYWYKVVTDYMSRDITYTSDRLMAICAIAKHFATTLGEENYKAGLWLNDIHAGLLWAPQYPGAVKVKEYVAPSWSWASIDLGALKDAAYLGKSCFYRRIPFSMSIPVAKILQVSVSNVNNDSFGLVDFGSLTVRSHCKQVCACRVAAEFLDRRCLKMDTDVTAYTKQFDTDPDSNLNDKVPLHQIGRQNCLTVSKSGHRKLLYLQIMQWVNKDPEFGTLIRVALILERTEDEIIERYRRVGRALIPEAPGHIVDWADRTVTIV